METELTATEDFLIREAVAAAQRAVLVASAAHEEAQKLGNQVQAVFRTILNLKGVNPDAYTPEVSEDGPMRLRSTAPADPPLYVPVD